MMNVYFTVDTESSISGGWNSPQCRPLRADRTIFCRIAGRDHGIGLISEILRHHGLHATYFVETLASLANGDDDTRAVFDYLLAHDQDVQLHIHPVYRFFTDVRNSGILGQPQGMPNLTTDLIGAYEEARQTELIEEAAALFQRFTGRSPAAFRAGCYGASRSTLRCLAKVGLTLDTSFNPCYPTLSFPGESLLPNRVCQIEGIWEIPVAVARTPLPEGYAGLKMADPCSLSFEELAAMIETAAAGGQEHFVVVFHSFSSVKRRDDTYSEIRADRIVIRRLEKLAAYLASHSSLYRVSTFSELAREITLDRVAASEGTFIPKLPVIPAVVRKSVQGLNRYFWF